MNVAGAERALLALDERVRIAVIRSGLQSLDTGILNHEQREIDAWHTELRKRIDDIESGKVTLLDVGESHAKLRSELTAHRGLCLKNVSIPRTSRSGLLV